MCVCVRACVRVFATVHVHVRVCVCVCERERERVCVCVCAGAGAGACACVSTITCIDVGYVANHACQYAPCRKENLLLVKMKEKIYPKYNRYQKCCMCKL